MQGEEEVDVPCVTRRPAFCTGPGERLVQAASSDREGAMQRRRELFSTVTKQTAPLVWTIEKRPPLGSEREEYETGQKSRIKSRGASMARMQGEPGKRSLVLRREWEGGGCEQESVCQRCENEGVLLACQAVGAGGRRLVFS